jgi:hypothetical protein
LGQRQHFYTFQVGTVSIKSECVALTCSSPRTFQELKEKLPLRRIEFPSLRWRGQSWYRMSEWNMNENWDIKFYCWTLGNVRISAHRVLADGAGKPSTRYLLSCLRLSCSGLRSHYHCAPRTLKVISNNLLCLSQSSPTAHSKICPSKETPGNTFAS